MLLQMIFHSASCLIEDVELTEHDPYRITLRRELHCTPVDNFV